VSVVAIDGPAGAGKSTIARALAQRLGYRYLDTGAMYRAVALAALRQSVDASDAEAVGRIAESAAIDISDAKVMLDGTDVTDEIRTSAVTEAVACVAAQPAVRAAMLARQQAEARKGDVVIEGRDIGSTVAPEAAVKIYLTASLEERARRRVRQMGLPENDASLRQTSGAIDARDNADSTRKASPLVKPPDAVEVDTTGLTVDEVVDKVARIVKEQQ
jgi:cytidylate kinase